MKLEGYALLTIDQQLYHERHLKLGYISSKGDNHDRTSWVGTKLVTQSKQLHSGLTEAAELVARSLGSQMRLFVSGGVDSQVMLRAFKGLGIPLHVVTFQFNSDLNSEDVELASRLCRELSISLDIIPFDVLDFFRLGHFQNNYKYRCWIPEIATHIEMIKRAEGYPVFAGNPPSPFMAETGEVQFSLPSRLHFATDFFLDQQKRLGIGNFFLYTRDLVTCFVAQSRKFVEGRPLHSPDDLYDFKCSLYESLGFAISRQQRKTTGFERVFKVLDAELNMDSRKYLMGAQGETFLGRQHISSFNYPPDG